MNIDYMDYEAIAALEHGSLADWAYESAMHYTDKMMNVYLLSSLVIANAALINMMTSDI